MFPFSVESEVTIPSTGSTADEYLHHLRACLEQEDVSTELTDDRALQFKTPIAPFGTLLLFLRALDGGRVCVDPTSSGFKAGYRLYMRRYWVMSLPGLALFIGLMLVFPPPLLLLPVLIGVLLCFMLGVSVYSYWGFRNFLASCLKEQTEVGGGFGQGGSS